MQSSPPVRTQYPDVRNDSFREEWLRYVATPDAQEIAGIKLVARQTFDLRGRQSLSRGVRSMLSIFELGLLYALARDHWKGRGAIIDAGPLLGASTFALARGLQDNDEVPPAQKSSSIYSFDLWIADSQFDRLLQGSSKSAATSSLLQEFLKVNREYVDYVVPHQGDFKQWQWPDSPIEILFMDLAKTWELNTHYVRTMLPHIVEGGFLVQQDYVHFNEYWVHITMEHFADHFEFCDVLYGATAVYRLCKPLTKADCAVDLKSLPYETKRQLLESAREKMPMGVRQVMKCAAAKCAIDHGQLEDAEALLDSVDPSDFSRSRIDRFSGIAGSNKTIVSRFLETAKAKRSSKEPV